ncbi:MAG: acyltransferase family protein [Gemmatimonadaceae bacterium]
MPAITSTVAPHASSHERLLALDVFRGMTVAAMLLVNNPGSWSAIYPPLAHAAWHGWTPTDLIFPFFLFIVGVTTHLSLDARRSHGADDRAIARQIFKRGALIYVLGLALNGFPYFDPVPGSFWGSIISRFGISPVTHESLLGTIRILGVLQRIAIVYVCAALISVCTTIRQQAIIAVVLLVGYWLLMTAVPVPGEGAAGAALLNEPARTLAAYVDRAVLGRHIYHGTAFWDPEGILSTVPAIVTAMLGIFAGRWIGQPSSLPHRIAGLFAIGSLGMVAGLTWGWVFPINKQLWTSSYVLFTGGMACVVLATCTWLIDLRHQIKWTKPFVPFGINPMIAFVGSGLMARTIYTLWRVESEQPGKYISIQAAIFGNFFLSWVAEPRLASFMFALTFVFVWWAILVLLQRRRIILKV